MGASYIVRIENPKSILWRYEDETEDETEDGLSPPRT
jgi:hypothetical protein